MRFHVPSFLIGCVCGGAALALMPRLRPLLLEIATASYRVLDQVSIQVQRRREDLEDLLAEARARSRQLRAPAVPSGETHG